LLLHILDVFIKEYVILFLLPKKFYLCYLYKHMDYVKQFDSTLNKTLENFVRKPTIVRGAVHLLLILYAARLAPTLPRPVLELFDNAYFKLFIFSLILWTAQFSPSTSILIALAFLVSTNYVNKGKVWESLENTEGAFADPTAAPVAESKQVAVEAASAIVEQQSQDAPVVASVAQKENTIVVQPTIVDTPQGPAVVNPTVVVAPAVVSTPDGEKVVIQPDVTVVSAPSNGETKATSTSTADIVTPSSPTVVAAAPVAGDAPAAAPSPAQEGCLPVRRYDMTKVVPQSSGGDAFGEFTPSA
jgi:hypothetical protein